MKLIGFILFTVLFLSSSFAVANFQEARSNNNTLTSKKALDRIGYKKTASYKTLFGYADTLNKQVKKNIRYSDSTTKKVKAIAEEKLFNNLGLIKTRNKNDLNKIDRLAEDRLDQLIFAAEDEYVAKISQIEYRATISINKSKRAYKKSVLKFKKQFKRQFKKNKKKAKNNYLIRVKKARQAHKNRTQNIRNSANYQTSLAENNYQEQQDQADIIVTAERNNLVSALNIRTQSEVKLRRLQKERLQKYLNSLSQNKAGKLQGAKEPGSNPKKDVKAGEKKREASKKRRDKKAAKAKKKAKKKAKGKAKANYWGDMCGTPYAPGLC